MPHMEIDEKEAKVILELAFIAFSEGLGAEGEHGLLNKIFTAYPSLKQEYPFDILAGYNEENNAESQV